MALARIRGISEAVEEIKEADPKSALTVHALRFLVKTGQVPSVKVGNKYLINMSVLESYLANPTDTQKEIHTGLRCVK